MTRVTEATADGVVRLENRFADGAAFIEGAYVPIAEARIPILDWGFTRSDVTYDVGPRLGRQVLPPGSPISTASRRASPASACPFPTTREAVVDILMRLMHLSQLRDAYVEVLCTRGMPPKGTRDPRACKNRFIAFAIPFVWIADEEMRARRHQPAPEFLPAHPAGLGRPHREELPLGRHDPRPVRELRAGLRHAGGGGPGRQHRRGGRASTSSP